MRSASSLRTVFVLLSVLVVPSAPARADPTTLTFGVYTSDKPTVMYTMFRPMVAQVEAKLHEALGQAVTVKLQIFKTYEDACDALVDGKIDFVRFGPTSYVIAKQRNAGINLLAIEEHGKEKKRSFKGVIFTRADAPIEKLADLKGRSFAFGNKFSTIGSHLVQAELVKAGIRASDLSSFENLDRHDLVVTSVLHGKFDAGAAKEDTFRKYEAQGLKALATFENVTKPWVARAKLESKVLDALRKALQSIEGAEVLGKIEADVTSLGAVEDAAYEPVRQGMKLAEQFLARAPGPQAAAAPGELKADEGGEGTDEENTGAASGTESPAPGSAGPGQDHENAAPSGSETPEEEEDNAPGEHGPACPQGQRA
jgi:phosphonate transport system substrate-binding protein